MDNYEKILDKQELRYVLGTAVSGKTTYLKKTLAKAEYEFVTDITKATKTISAKIANIILENYVRDTGDTTSELIVIPLLISYELIKEV